MGECFGLEPGTGVTFEMNTALRRCRLRPGVRHQLHGRPDHHRGRHRAAHAAVQGARRRRRDRRPAAVHELLAGLGQVPRALLPRVPAQRLSAKSPQQMFGALIKTYYAEKLGSTRPSIVTVALMPCSAKKFECNRPEMDDSGYKDVDYGLTTRELAKMIRETGLDLPTCRSPTSTRRSAPPPARASSSAPPAGSWRPPCAPSSSGDGREGGEPLRARRHHPAARLEGVKYAGSPCPRSARRPIVAHLFPTGTS